MVLCGSGKAAAYNTYTVALWKYPNFTIDPVRGNNLTMVGTVPTQTQACGTGTGMQGVFSDSNYYTYPSGVVNMLTQTAVNYWSIEGDVYITGAMVFPSMFFWSSNGDSQLDATGNHARWSTTGGTLVGATALSTNTCYHVSYLCNGNASKTIFLGSVSDATAANDGRFGTSASMIVGKNGSSGGFSFSAGYIDNLRVNIYPNSAAASAATFPTIDPPANTAKSPLLKNYPRPYLGVHR